MSGLIEVLKKLDNKCTDTGPATPNDIKSMLKAIIGADEETQFFQRGYKARCSDVPGWNSVHRVTVRIILTPIGLLKAAWESIKK
jgi:hypothetical protein